MSIVEKIAFISAGLLIVILLGLIVFSDNGIVDYKKLTKKEKKVLSQIQMVEQQNQRLAGEVNKIKTDAEYLKHLARHEYNMVEEEEFLFKDRPENKAKDKEANP